MLRALGLVPARGGSKRIERKNLARLGGRTLVRRALETAVAAGCFEAVALSSEDPEILAEARGLPVLALERPAALATDTARSFDVVLDALRAAETEHGRAPFDAVAVVQATSPFTAPEDLAGTVALLDSSGAGSAVSIARVESAVHPLKLKRLEGDRLVPFLEDDAMTPSHELPELWVRNGSVYVSRREVLDAGTFIADDVRGYPMPAERSYDVDTPLDLAFAEFLIERGSGERGSGPG
ncbi:MAG: cytidylyltransferase domain-containing protein [Solirubrobacteraceae bacterium]